MATEECLKMLNAGADAWNAWRATDEGTGVDLSDIDFVDACSSKGFYDLPELQGYDFSMTNMNRVSMRNSAFVDCNFSGCSLSFSDLVDSYCLRCDFSKASLNVSRIGSGSFIDCKFHGSDLSYCSAEETDFRGSELIGANLNNMSLVKTNFSDAIIEGSCAYGVSVWDLKLEGCNQGNIYISQYSNPITVPTIELAQFISLLVNSKKLRDVIETITSKVILILGRFTPKRKAVLDQIKEQLDMHGYLAVIFDFEVPAGRDLTETIITLAALSKFVIADISDPKSIPQELSVIVPQLPSVPVQPIIEQNLNEYGMFEHFNNYPWVLKPQTYQEDNLQTLVQNAVQNCENYLAS